MNNARSEVVTNDLPKKKSIETYRKEMVTKGGESPTYILLLQATIISSG